MPFNVLLRADCEVLVDRKNIFITCTHEALAGGHLEMIQPDGVILEIPFLAVTATDEIEARLHALTDIAKRGFRLAFDHAALTRPYVRWLTLASFIKLDLAKLCNRVHCRKNRDRGSIQTGGGLGSETVSGLLVCKTGAVRRSGTVLELTQACESTDDGAFGRTANALHLNNRQLDWAPLQAPAWAEILAD